MASREKIALRIKSVDNVATTLNDVVKDDMVTIKSADGTENRVVQAKEDIPFGFKISLKDILKGEHVIKYGEIIGRANDFIGEGCLVHIHNVEGLRGRGDLRKGSKKS
ncbi:MAG: UxaA family hydrolase [Nitrososphaeria archaeon]